MPPPQVNKPPAEKKVDLEEALAQMLTSHIDFMNETKVNMQSQLTQLNNQAAQLKNVEIQMGQMVNLLTKRQQGAMLINSKVNSRNKGKEYCKTKTLRSGREVAALEPPPLGVKEPKHSY